MVRTSGAVQDPAGYGVEAGASRAAALPEPAARRLMPARWLDPRLVVGLLLVLAPVAIGARLVAAADATTPVWATSVDLSAGVRLAAEDLRTVDVDLAEGLDRYLPADAAPPVGAVLSRPVSAGELLPRTALASPDGDPLRRLVVEVDAVTAGGLARGAVVDVYLVPEAVGGERPESSLVRAGVTVDGVAQDRGALSAGGATAGVVLLVAPDAARDLLDAQAAGSLRLLEVRAGAGAGG